LGVLTTHARTQQEVFAIAMSLISCGLFIYLTVEVSMDNTGIFREAWIIYIELGMSIFAVFDYILHFFLAETKYVSLRARVSACDACLACVGSRQDQAHHGSACAL
jgi:hypothetical protein